MIELVAHARGVLIAVRARPGARRDEVLGEHGGALRISVTTKPEAGKANEAIRRVLAEALGIKPAQVELVTGQTSREKRFLILNTDLDEVRARVSLLLNP